MTASFGQNMNEVIFMSDITPTQTAQLRSMLNGASQLSDCLSSFSAQAVSPQLKDELAKLAATCGVHKDMIHSMLGGNEQ